MHACIYIYIYAYMNCHIYAYIHICCTHALSGGWKRESLEALHAGWQNWQTSVQIYWPLWGIAVRHRLQWCYFSLFWMPWEACRGAIGINLQLASIFNWHQSSIGINLADGILLSTVSSAYSNLSQGGEKVISPKNFESFIWHHVSMEKYTNR